MFAATGAPLSVWRARKVTIHPAVDRHPRTWLGLSAKMHAVDRSMRAGVQLLAPSYSVSRRLQTHRFIIDVIAGAQVGAGRAGCGPGMRRVARCGKATERLR